VVCLWCVIVNTLHKGDNKDNNNNNNNNNNKGTRMLIDVAIPGNKNVIKK
jgi:hypothetical protein